MLGRVSKINIKLEYLPYSQMSDEPIKKKKKKSKQPNKTCLQEFQWGCETCVIPELL